MRLKVYKRGGYASGGISQNGGTVTGPLVLYGNPSVALEASTKSYVETIFSNLPATGFKTGILPVSALPGYTGDVTNTPGSNQFTLANTGITASSYTKYTVNEKGVLTNGYNLTPNDLPSISWTKVIGGKPSTLAGYGITDALTPSGGVLTGTLSINASPTDPKDIATKAFVDSITPVAGSAMQTGFVLRKPTSVTPAGFLKCNGGEISKTTYPELYSVVGDTYSFSQVPGNGKPWQHQFEMQVSTTPTLTADNTLVSSFPIRVLAPQFVVTENQVYAMGGYDNAAVAAVNTIYRATINPDGSLSTWELLNLTLPGNRYNFQTVVTKNRLYILGGNDGTARRSETYYINIDSIGDITSSSWMAGPTLPTVHEGGQAFITKNRVYYIGGLGPNNLNMYQSAPIDASGVIGTWGTMGTLPVDMSYIQVVITNTKVYYVPTNGSAPYTPYYTTINSDGTLGTFNTDPKLVTVNIGGCSFYTTKYYVYAFGGVGKRVFRIAIGGGEVYWDNAEEIFTTTHSDVNYFSSWFTTKDRVWLMAPVSIASGIVNSTNCYYMSITGVGFNDMSPYYNGTFNPTDPLNFRLPDYTSTEIYGSTSYIKT